ncbi:glutathione binding-like protein [Myxococcus sp. K15C18031901]|uniref:glutathione S-transferase family protein n=1 Tax=Myxococcus dinghuensis TaxID=2906761 RepID=UPI0020A81056|nr:glutathione binding-like protein [Myxococcus dinghuensis]MCP3100944.1 glutathione binding-like protein [Myxococcus dinghuensis]
MKLYGNSYSTCTLRALLALAEKGLEAELIPVDLAKGEQRLPQHRAVHPFAKIPVLIDGDFRLYESGAIIRYVDGLPSSAPSLIPADAKTRAVMDQWVSVEPSYLQPHIFEIRKQLFLNPMFGGKTDPAEVEKARESVAYVLDVLERALEGKHYLAGDTFTLADLVYVPTLQFLVIAKQDDLILTRRNVAAWWERIGTRPAWKRIVAGAPAR